jgi:hypothetical protein
VRHSATMALAQTCRNRNRDFGSSITKRRVRLAITLTSSRRGCGNSSNRSSAHLIHSQISRLHLQACQQAWRGAPWLQVVDRLARRPSTMCPVQCAALCSEAQVINLVASGSSTSSRPDRVQQHAQYSTLSNPDTERLGSKEWQTLHANCCFAPPNQTQRGAIEHLWRGWNPDRRVDGVMRLAHRPSSFMSLDALRCTLSTVLRSSAPSVASKLHTLLFLLPASCATRRKSPGYSCPPLCCPLETQSLPSSPLALVSRPARCRGSRSALVDCCVWG